MNKIEQKVLALINIDDILEYLGKLVATPSFAGKESVAQKKIASKLVELGLEVDMWEMDFNTLQTHPDFSMQIPREEGIGVIGTLKGVGGGRSLIFNGHIDTVAPGEKSNWSLPALQGSVIGDKFYGRGVADMKGGLCCAIFAVKAIIEAGVILKGDLSVQSVIGEEDGGVGALSTVLRGYSADAAVVMEPTEVKVAPAHSGALAFTIEVFGRSAHACVREEGVSAIEKFIQLFNALRELEKERNSGINDPLYSRYDIPYPINIGTIQGGNWPGTVPERLVFQGRIGIIVGESIENAKMSFENMIKKVSDADPWFRTNPPRIEWSGYQFDSAKINLGSSIVETVLKAYSDDTGEKAKLEGMTYASDMRHLINTGKIPTVLFGPGDVRQAHAPDEYVKIEELVTVTRVLALTALRFCGYET